MTEKSFLYKTFLRLKITHKKERRRNVRYHEFPNPRSLKEDDSEPRGVAACRISSEESRLTTEKGKHSDPTEG